LNISRRIPFQQDHLVLRMDDLIVFLNDRGIEPCWTELGYVTSELAAFGIVTAWELRVFGPLHQTWK
jgi:hypothetical protein